MRITVPRLLVLTLLLIIGAGVAHKYAIKLRIQNLSSRLKSTHIDFELNAAPLPDAVSALRQRLVEADPYFANCEFRLEVDTHSPGPLLSLTLSETSGEQCLIYVTELSGEVFRLRPGTVIISHIHDFSDHRDPVERTIDSTVAWLGTVKEWTKHKLGLNPVPPSPDPFAPFDPEPKNPFGF